MARRTGFIAALRRIFMPSTWETNAANHKAEVAAREQRRAFNVIGNRREEYGRLPHYCKLTLHRILANRIYPPSSRHTHKSIRILESNNWIEVRGGQYRVKQFHSVP